MSGRPRLFFGAGVAVLVAAVVLAFLGLRGHTTVVEPTAGAAPVGADAPVGAVTLANTIAALQATLKVHPDDADSWGTLGLDYVEQARASVDPSYYPKAEGALAMSMQLEPTDNFIAAAGQAALASGRHDFTAALTAANAGITIDPYNAALYEAQADALTQLGRYDEAQAAIQKALNLKPETPAYSRASYVYELKGDIPNAVAAMKTALSLAPTPSDIAFCDYYLGELAFNYGQDYQSALTYQQAAIKPTRPTPPPTRAARRPTRVWA